MKIYKSYKELKGKSLEYGDILHFKVKGEVLEYTTMSNWLSCINDFNDIIFYKLNIKNKHKFCSKSYGYKAVDDNFPECHQTDYEALNRVALELFKLCDNYGGNKK